MKGSGGLGFTLAGGADTTGGCFVRDVIGDPAKADGRLQKGDQIIKVNVNWSIASNCSRAFCMARACVQ